jgi:hypothetical protein
VSLIRILKANNKMVLYESLPSSYMVPDNAVDLLHLAA